LIKEHPKLRSFHRVYKNAFATATSRTTTPQRLQTYMAMLHIYEQEQAGVMSLDKASELLGPTAYALEGGNAQFSQQFFEAMLALKGQQQARKQARRK
jgi:hypothetical protein